MKLVKKLAIIAFKRTGWPKVDPQYAMCWDDAFEAGFLKCKQLLLASTPGLWIEIPRTHLSRLGEDDVKE